MTTHRFRAHCAWDGSTAEGYDRYGRFHVATTDPSTSELVLSADPTFRGNPRLMNPEQLLLIAASSCQLLSFLALAARARIDVTSYEDHAEAEMPEENPPIRVTRITLRPRIAIADDADETKVLRLIKLAHEECFIANSLRTSIEIAPEIVTTDPEASVRHR